MTAASAHPLHADPDRPRLALGRLGGVDFDVVAWAPHEARVDLSFACMFEHEAAGAALAGGLLALDRALQGRLTALRASGVFRARALETLHLGELPAGMAPGALLVIGLGDPDAFDGATLERAAELAATCAIRLGASSAAFAPNLLDAGLAPGPGMPVAATLLDGAARALATAAALRAAGLARPPRLRHWSFDTGAAHIDAAGREFAERFQALSSLQAPPPSSSTQGSP
jgi:hypothetical protein